MAYPVARHRRLRSTEAMRGLVRETVLEPADFIAPLFVTEGEGVQEEIASMPGVFHWSLDTMERELAELVAAGVTSVMLFGVPNSKDALGTSAYDDDGITQRAIRKIKTLHPGLAVAADNCLCQYTDHGHCGIVRETARGAVIDNDESLALLAKTAVSQAKAGADIIAPSNMMDGFVTAIRQALDAEGYENVPIMSYSVKYSSAYYGPFREAAHSTPQFGDRKTYQMDPANAREALREAQSDVEEGADFLMVKPALAYLDIVRMLRDRYALPIVAYNVSAEYSMVKAAALQGWIDEKAIVLETLTGMKRAGADLIITYHAKDAARWLTESRTAARG
ncbi:porphobilinogen synthase [Paenibacillaceae bacterium WGS1546]|uniref:porphobilinogen synthase n=1 Tax=Cohnella sp. WGS1546 TaxID=3366810 RepID=UPI00372D7EC4